MFAIAASALILVGLTAPATAHANSIIGDSVALVAAGCPASVYVDSNGRTGVIYGQTETCTFNVRLTCIFAHGTQGTKDVKGVYGASFDCGYKFISYVNL